jgi:hypothetical protein
MVSPRLAQVAQGSSSLLELPKGNWSLVVRPVRPVIDGSAPVDIFHVRTHAGMGIAVTRAGLINHSSRGVIGVRLGWTLYLSSGAVKRLLAVGTTRLIILSQPLNSGEAAHVTAPFISFAVSLRMLITEPGRGLEGAFSIELSPFELQFEDGGSWFAGSPLPGSSDTEFEIGEVRVISPVEMWMQPCPDQSCFFDGRLQCYVCASDANYYCDWESCLACNTGWCFLPPPKTP